LCLLLFLPGFFTLPPLDRDESRFAQATKQMMESGDFVEIRFQDQARNKKPAGIYWLQAVPASILSGADHNRIWAYRIPSFLAALAAVLLTNAIGARAFDRRTGFLAGVLLSSSVLLVVESGIAKTDAALLACTVLAMYFLAHLYLQKRDDPPVPDAKPTRGRSYAYGVWAALGLGLLIKGPVILLVVGLASITLMVWDRSLALLKSLRPLTGLLVMAAIALPWFVAIYFATDGAFFAEALGKDFGSKITSGQESHGAPVGLYTAIIWLTLWPASLLLLPMIPWAWKAKSDPAIRFLVAWFVPTWIVMELIPTKLPHYPLPLYPALALLMAAMIVRTLAATRLASRAKLTQSWVGRLGLLLWVIPGLALAASISILPDIYGNGATPMLMAASGLGGLLVLSVAVLFWHGRLLVGTIAASLAGLFIYAGLFEAAMKELPALRLSPLLYERLQAHNLDDDEAIGILGYSEPSFVFLNGTETQLLKGKTAVDFLVGEPGRTILVEVRKDSNFRQALQERGLSVVALDEVEGFNYSKGREMTLTFYQLSRPFSDGPIDE
jgi:4-amino-4-deoxy-L-arabinose transferase-like glycosyltransferase